MQLIIPVSHIDLHLARKLIPWMAQLGPYPAHSAVLLFSPELDEEIKIYLKHTMTVCGFASVLRATARLMPHEDGWPAGPNGLFRNAVSLVLNDPRFHRAWYFFEPDNTPMGAGWLDSLQFEYDIAREERPFMGSIQPTQISLGNGEMMETGQHLMGSAIYPHDMERFTAEWSSHDPENAFDLAMQGDIVDAGYARNTNAIQHNWSTGHYSRDFDGVIRCQPMETRVRRMLGDPISTDVRQNALVVHGCKDGSLIDLLQKERNPSKNVPVLAGKEQITPKNVVDNPITEIKEDKIQPVILQSTIPIKRGRGRPRKIHA